MSKQGYSASDIVFLLGAGATVDAGMPTIKGLTERLIERFERCQDKEFIAIYELLAKADSLVESNYEKFFEYTELIKRASSIEDIFCIRMPDYLIRTINNPFSTDVIRTLMNNILRTCQKDVKPEYLSYLQDFLPENGRLKVFTLNYDLCVETACKNKGVLVTTGFNHEWNPLLFYGNEKGINLYKLHGSLLWFYDDNWTIQELSELPENKNPEIVLGPGSKMQADDPFLTLFYEFSRAVQEAKICIVVGYGYQDAHVNTVLERSKVDIIDVNLKHADILNKTNKQAILITSTACNCTRILRIMPTSLTAKNSGLPVT
ncbi:MAG: SIR2 family protein [Nitrospirae bacterium]|nr:SIR2 family protein [Nitrospirota bacterium]